MYTKYPWDSKHKKLWAYIWLLDCSSQQISNLKRDIERQPDDVFPEFIWALNFLEITFGE